MWSLSRTTARQREIRKSRVERRGAWFRRALGAFDLWSLGLTATAILVAAALMELGGEVMPHRVGEQVSRPIASRIAFDVYDHEQTMLLRMRARERSPGYFTLDATLVDEIRGRLLAGLTLARTHSNDPQQLRSAAASRGLVLDEAATTELLRQAAGPGEAYQREIEAALRALAGVPLVEASEDAQRRTAVTAGLIDGRDGVERLVMVSVGRLLYSNKVDHARDAAAEAARSMSPALRASVEATIAALLKVEGDRGCRPLYRYDAVRSSREEEAAVAAVSPQMVRFKAGALLADVGALDATEVETLRAEHQAWLAAAVAADGGWSTLQRAWLARGFLAAQVIFGLALYLSRFQSRVFRNPVRLTIVTGVLLGVLLLARLTHVWSAGPAHLAVGFQALAAAMLAIVYTRGSVFAICAALGLLMTLAMRQDPEFFVILLAVSGVFVAALSDVRNRGKIVGVGALAALAALATTVAVGFVHQQAPQFILREALWAAGATVLAAFVIEGVLPGIERIFKFSTSMTLLEWCDASKPLLRMMAAEAPGTYNHSLLVGALSEAAADSVGANGLLCRAGAYYHDIGKINKPEYFVENQQHGASRHEGLSPAMSLLIIVGHVKDGIEMAKEYGLPASLRPFIAEHHGTTLVEYFYHAANRQRRSGDAVIRDTEYRYPGPRPQTRETAIVMLCDGVEGAVRAMSDPTPGRIETVVSDIVRKRLMDGQFDECDLTFRELATIERSLVKSLCGLYHARIAYPEGESRTSATRSSADSRTAS